MKGAFVEMSLINGKVHSFLHLLRALRKVKFQYD